MATTEESEYLDLHNTYKAKYEAEDANLPQDYTFVLESSALLKYIEVLVNHSQGLATAHSEKEVFEVKNRVVHIIQQYQEQPGLLDPHLVLQRGYAWLQDPQGRTLSKIAQAHAGLRVRATLVDGTVDMRVSDPT